MHSARCARAKLIGNIAPPADREKLALRKFSRVKAAARLLVESPHLGAGKLSEKVGLRASETANEAFQHKRTNRTARTERAKERRPCLFLIGRK